jgi:hypothetical protein
LVVEVVQTILNPKSQAPNLRVSGVGCPAYALLSYGVASRCQGRETQKLKPETSILDSGF